VVFVLELLALQTSTETTATVQVKLLIKEPKKHGMSVRIVPCYKC